MKMLDEADAPRGGALISPPDPGIADDVTTGARGPDSGGSAATTPEAKPARQDEIFLRRSAHPALKPTPADILVEGSRLVIRHNGHSVTGTLGSDAMLVDGSAVRFASAPTLVGGKLYLPLELYVRIGAVPLNSR